MSADSFVLIGKIDGVYGVKGFLKVYSYTQPRTEIINWRNWYLKRNDAYIPADIESVQSHRNGASVLLKLKDVETPEAGLLYSGVEIYLPEHDFTKLDAGDYYWHELIGMSVINQHGIHLGEVVKLMETGANDVLVIQGSQKYLIPYLRPNIVTAIEHNQIHVNWEFDWT